MFELIYHSISNPSLKAEDISNILQTSRKFNSINNVTGCLLYRGSEFLQILEGDKKVIKDLYASIQRDERHSNVYVIIENEKNERSFGDWSMAFHEFNGDFTDKTLSFSNYIHKQTIATDLFWEMARQIVSNHMSSV